MTPEASNTVERQPASSPKRLKISVLEHINKEGTEKEERMVKMQRGAAKATSLVIDEKKKNLNERDCLAIAIRAAFVHQENPALFERDFERVLLPILKSAVTIIEKEYDPISEEKKVGMAQNFTELSPERQRRIIMAARFYAYRRRFCAFSQFQTWQTSEAGQKLFQDATNKNETALRKELRNPSTVSLWLLSREQQSAESAELIAKMSTDRFVNDQKSKKENPAFFQNVRSERGMQVFTVNRKGGKPLKFEILEVNIGAGQTPDAVFKKGFRFRSLDLEGAIFLYDPATDGARMQFDPEKINVLAIEAIKNREQEKNAENALKKYDLPKGVPIVHLRVFPRVLSDAPIAGSMFDGALLTNALQQRYPNVHAPAPILTEEPARDIRKEIAESQGNLKNKRIHVCIDVFSHGNENALEFIEPMRQSDLVDLVKSFPEVTFTFNTIGCLGGGMRGILTNKAYTENPDVMERLAVFLQTKPLIENIGGSDDISPYYLHLINGLMDGLTYGASAQKADVEVKKDRGIDAEAIVDGALHP